MKFTAFEAAPKSLNQVFVKNILGELSSDAEKDELFDPSVWSEPLAKFAKATGLTISLYDQHGERRSNVITASPIGARLASAKFWSPGALGDTIDQDAAKACIAASSALYNVQLETFAHLAIPILIEGKALAALVLGWIPDRFADPVNCDSVSKKIQAEPLEIWQLMRMQQPISQEKLESHAGMLETFAGPLMHQLIVREDHRRRALRSKIISETSQAFAESTTERQICLAAISSLCQIIRTTAITIEVVKIQNELENKSRYSDAWPTTGFRECPDGELFSHWKIPITATQARPLGTVEITLAGSFLSEESKADVLVVVGQFGIALQKVHLIEALEGERSALKGANSQLEHLHKMKDEFLATISHELRTPLNAVLGWSQMLIDEGPTMPEFKEAVATIEQNAKNQLHLIEDLLDVSRIISGKMNLVRDDIEATAILKQSMQTVFPMIEARRQKVHLQVSPTPLYLKGDATRLTQIFWNILSNASKFTPDGGAISVVLENAGHYLRLAISDSGKGIPQDFLPHLFDRFSQADGSFTRRHGGLGLGLAIVRHLVELHGGTVTATSEGEGKGSTFTVFLPQNTTDQELDNARTLTEFSESATKKATPRLQDRKVLLIDDEPNSLRLARFVLEKSGAAVKTCDSAAEGYEAMLDWQPDIIISDISMPGESGYELIRRIRFLNSETGARVPAIALTALASNEKREMALSAGFDLHLAKPLEPNKLVSAVAQLLLEENKEAGASKV